MYSSPCSLSIYSLDHGLSLSWARTFFSHRQQFSYVVHIDDAVLSQFLGSGFMQQWIHLKRALNWENWGAKPQKTSSSYMEGLLTNRYSSVHCDIKSRWLHIPSDKAWRYMHVYEVTNSNMRVVMNYTGQLSLRNRCGKLWVGEGWGCATCMCTSVQYGDGLWGGGCGKWEEM